MERLQVCHKDILARNTHINPVQRLVGFLRGRDVEQTITSNCSKFCPTRFIQSPLGLSITRASSIGFSHERNRTELVLVHLQQLICTPNGGKRNPRSE